MVAIRTSLSVVSAALLLAGTALAQGGPPMRTDDPGTPGNRNLEMNVAASYESSHGERVIDAPLLDMNYGVGNRLQLKFELPWVQHSQGQLNQAGLGNSLAGVK